MPKVVITGACGFLGSHLADEFLEKKWDVIGVDNLIGGYRSNLSGEVKFFDLDLTGPIDSLGVAFEGAELVIHAACTAYEGLSVFSPSLVVDNTVMATTNALAASVNGGAKKFVYMSSMARYGDHHGEPFEEHFETKAQDPYGIAKVASEKLVENICQTHGLEHVILVPHNIIGPRQKYDDPYRNVASIMINRMLQGKQPIIYGDGQQQRCFSFISDVVDPILEACLSNTSVGEVINIGPDEETITINELAVELSKIIGFQLDPIYIEGRPMEVRLATCSAQKARTLLGYETKVSLRNGLEELVDWIRSQGAKEFSYHLPLEIVNGKTPKTWTQKLI